MNAKNEPNLEPHSMAVRVQTLFSALEKIAGFELPNLTKQKFTAVHASITVITRLPNLTRLTFEGGSHRDWLTILKLFWVMFKRGLPHLTTILLLSNQWNSNCLT